MLFSNPGNVLLVAQERASRLLIVSRQCSKAARPIAEQLRQHFAWLPQPLRQSVTFDNGAEFTHHHRLNRPPHAYLLLRQACSMAEGRHRKRHRQTAPRAATQNTHRTTPPAPDHPARPTLQTTPPENASASKLLPNSSHPNCCTSNVNPHLRCAQDDSLTTAWLRACC